MNDLTTMLATVKALQEALPVVNTLASGAAGGLITHLLARRLDDRKHAREQAAAQEKQKTALQFISIELIYLLESYATHCRDEVFRTDKSVMPALTEPAFSGVTGNWQVLPVSLLYQIRELTPATVEAIRTREFYLKLGYAPLKQIAILESEDFLLKAGLKAIRLARWLRRLNDFPPTKLAGHDSSVHQGLWTEYRNRIRERETDYAESIGRMTRSVPDTPAQETGRQ